MPLQSSLSRWALERECRARRFLWGVSMSVAAGPLAFGMAAAQRPAPPSAELAHAAWTVRDGAPGAVRGLAQGADGVLWIASERGLFQFDGVRFERFDASPGEALPPRGAHVLLALPDTTLWVGHFGSGVSVIHRGRVVSYDTPDGLPGGTVTAIARDSSGTVWASTTRGLARLSRGRWQPVGAEAGDPGGFTEPVLVDARGSVWAVTISEIYVLRRGASRFERRTVSISGGRDSTVQWLSVAGDGSLRGVQQPMGCLSSPTRTERLSAHRRSYVRIRAPSRSFSRTASQR